MAARRRKSEEVATGLRQPATNPMARERQLISRAVDLAERQLIEGTASSQVITHYLKMSSSREMLEQERIEQEIALLRTKAEMIESQKRIESMYGEALNAMRAYNGQDPLDSGEDG